MNKTYLSFVSSVLIGLLLITQTAFSQISITTSDMPSPGDSVLITLDGLNTFDGTKTGSGYTWDYSFLALDSQQTVKFVKPLNTPYSFFSLFAGLALHNPSPDPFPFILLGSAPTNAYDFFTNSSANFRMVGTGLTLSGTAIPIIYNSPDIVYKFPLNMGKIDSSNSGFALPIPGFGYYGKSQKRVNQVDGSGTLITPYGTFPTLRVKSVITASDTVHLDSLNLGLRIPRPTVIQYKWLGTKSKIPLLEIDVQSVLGVNTVTRVAYQDSAYKPMELAMVSSNTCVNTQQGTAEAVVKNGKAPYTYSWSNGRSGKYITALGEGSYTVTVTDRYGRTIEGVATVNSKIKQHECLNIPNAFTPDADGVNDTWVIRNIDEYLYPATSVEIMDAWGSIVFRSGVYTKPWDGTFNNEPVPTGTYYYIIELGDGEKYTGTVTIIR